LGLPVDQTPLLRERCWGVFEGRPAAEGHRLEAALAADQAVPDGESREDVAQRLHQFLASLSGVDGPVVVVTHGDVIREVLPLWGDARHDAGHLMNGCVIRTTTESAIIPHSTMSRQP
jgi:broad specificity phosphatase PhoE